MSEAMVSGAGGFELTDSMRDLGIVNLSISDPGIYHDPVVRMYAGASIASEANAIYRSLHALREGDRTNLSIAFDLVSQNGINPFEEGRAEIGRVGTAIYDATDMQRAVEGIPLDQTSTSMTINGTAPYMLASYIVAGERTGVAPTQLRGTTQNDVLKEHFRNTVSADLDGAFKIACDIVEYTTAQGNVPNWFGLSASGYHMAEAGASSSREIGITQANAEATLDNMLDRGYSVEDVARRFSFFYVTRPDNYILEVAKLRAARIIWANRLHAKYENDDPASQKMRMHVHTAGEAMPQQYLEIGTLLAGHSAMAAQLAPAQSLHVVGFREALSIPDERERIMGMYTPRLQNAVVKTLRRIIDRSPEFHELVYKQVAGAAEVLKQIDESGGALRALRTELPQRMIAGDSVEREEEKNSGEIPVLGKSIGPKDSERFSVTPQEIDPEVREQYLADLRERLDARDPALIAEHIARLELVARSSGVNIMEPTIAAVRAGVNVWEWNEAIRNALGTDDRPILLASESAIMSRIAESVSSVRAQLLELYPDKPPRILVTKIGVDGHDRGAKTVIKIAEGSGFDVEQGHYRPTPAEIAADAIEKEVDVIAVSTLSGSHKEQIAALIEALDEQSGPDSDIGIIVGGTIPRVDIDTLLEMRRVMGVVDSQDNPSYEDVGLKLLDAANKVLLKHV
jgi:methylmalonyl-CoA mutase